MTNIQYNESDSVGVVTSVSDGSLTITDDASGQSETFTADPGAGLFDGIALGDQIDVTWHQSGAQTVADNVNDYGAGPDIRWH